MSARIVIDPEFQAVFPSLESSELAELEKQLLADGCRDALTVWPVDGSDEAILLDGHNRYHLCTKHGLPFNTSPVKLPDRDAAIAWILRHQLGRRNLTPDQFKLRLGQLYEQEKKAIGGDRKSGYQNGTMIDDGRTRDRLAKEHGVSPQTVNRAGKLARAVAAIKNERPDISEKDAIHEAKQVIRETKSKTITATAPTPDKLPRAQRIAQIKELAEKGFRAAQIAKELGICEEHVFGLANKGGVVLPDKVMGKTRRIDHNRIVEETISAISGISIGLEMLDINLIDRDKVVAWFDSLNASLPALNRLRKQLKELAHG